MRKDPIPLIDIVDERRSRHSTPSGELIYKLSNTPPVAEDGTEAGRIGGGDPAETSAPSRWDIERDRPLWQWVAGLAGLGLTVFTIGYFWTKGTKKAA